MSQSSEADRRLIIPAPAKTRQETGITWYEARVVPQERTVYLEAFASRDRKLAELRTRVDAGTALTTAISDAENRLEIEMRGRTTDSRDLEIQGRINEREFAISGRLGERESAQPTRPELSADEQDLLRPWTGLANSLEALVQATREPAAAEEAAPAYDCDACLLVGATVVVAAEGCVGGDPGQCSVLIDAYDLFRDHCDPPPCH